MLGTTTFAFVASEVQFIKVIGVGIAISVVIDATLVRMALVPAFLVLMGEWNWWIPAPLAKLIDLLGVSDDKIVLQDFSGGLGPKEVAAEMAGAVALKTVADEEAR